MEVVPLRSAPRALMTLNMRHSYLYFLKSSDAGELIHPKHVGKKSLIHSLHQRDNKYAERHVACKSDMLTHRLRGEDLPLVPSENVHRNKLNRFLHDNSNLSVLLLYFARNGLLSSALEFWDEILNSSLIPEPEVVSELICIYGTMRDFDMVKKILYEVQMKYSEMLLHDICCLAISCFGQRGQLDCMDIVIKHMVSLGLSVDSAVGNAYVLYYSTFGSLVDMEAAYGHLKRSRILIEEEAIRAVSRAYIKENKFYALSCFVQDIGLGRKNVGNLLWNLLLLSYAANFKMKSLQREFVRMVEAGFSPDLNTFNIRLLAFSRMSLLWDLHLSLEHMNHRKVVPDLVSYGCVVDAYLDRRLGNNLNFSLSKLRWNDCVTLSTDPIIYEVMGKGDFHLSSEAMLEFAKEKDWNYKMLISSYLKKKLRSNLIFWNY